MRKSLALGEMAVEVVAAVKVLLHRRMALLAAGVRARARHQLSRGILGNLRGIKALGREGIVMVGKGLRVMRVALALSAHGHLAEASRCSRPQVDLWLLLPLLLSKEFWVDSEGGIQQVLAGRVELLLAQGQRPRGAVEAGLARLQACQMLVSEKDARVLGLLVDEVEVRHGSLRRVMTGWSKGHLGPLLLARVKVAVGARVCEARMPRAVSIRAVLALAGPRLHRRRC